VIDYNGKQYVCFLDLGLEPIRGKWKAVILCHLSNGPKRFLELQRVTTGVSQKVLNQQLRELEDDQLIEKIVYPEVPPRVEYCLTKKGLELSPILELITKWAEKHYIDCSLKVKQPS
jgi:DNA-binding HxlR family transcriptional regulator